MMKAHFRPANTAQSVAGDRRRYERYYRRYGIGRRRTIKATESARQYRWPERSRYMVAKALLRRWRASGGGI